MRARALVIGRRCLDFKKVEKIPQHHILNKKKERIHLKNGQIELVERDL